MQRYEYAMYTAEDYSQTGLPVELLGILSKAKAHAEDLAKCKLIDERIEYVKQPRPDLTPEPMNLVTVSWITEPPIGS